MLVFPTRVLTPKNEFLCLIVLLICLFERRTCFTGTLLFLIKDLQDALSPKETLGISIDEYYKLM